MPPDFWASAAPAIVSPATNANPAANARRANPITAPYTAGYARARETARSCPFTTSEPARPAPRLIVGLPSSGVSSPCDLGLETPDARGQCPPARIGHGQGVELVDQVGDVFRERPGRPLVDTQAAHRQAGFLGQRDPRQFRLIAIDLAKVFDRDMPARARAERVAIKRDASLQQFGAVVVHWRFTYRAFS